MRFQKYLNESLVDNLIKPIKKFTAEKAKKFLKQKWNELQKIIKDQGIEADFLKIINKNLKTNYKSLDQINNETLSESYLTEDFTHFWNYFKDNTFPALSFYPALTIWLELDKIFDGGSINLQKIGVYGVFFITLLAGSHLKNWYQWKKKNPEEFKEEGEPGPFSYKK